MIPMGCRSPAIACGNAFILKPSARDRRPLMLAELGWKKKPSCPRVSCKSSTADQEAV